MPIEIEDGGQAPRGTEDRDATPAPSPSGGLREYRAVGEGDSASALEASLSGPHLFGVYPALVVANENSRNPAELKVALPWLPDENGAPLEVSARLAQFAAGPDRGAWFMPEIDDEVLVAFEAGDPNRAYVIGSLWNGLAQPPDTDVENNRKQIITRKTKIVIQDDPAGASITIEMKDSDRSITVHEQEGIKIADGATRIILRDGRIELQAAATVDIAASLVNIDAALVNTTGVLKTDTLQATNVVASSYTPGAGNIW